MPASPPFDPAEWGTPVRRRTRNHAAGWEESLVGGRRGGTPTLAGRLQSG